MTDTQTEVTERPIDLVKYAHIPDAKIEQDIAETVEEIELYRALQTADRLRADNRMLPDHERTLAAFTASARPHQIAKREDFIAFLRRILDARKAAATLPTEE